jgi:pantoate--beta-alanine ligase
VYPVEIFNKVADVKEYVKAKKAQGKSIGLVPTMGALHEGHLSLMKGARRECDVVIASIFVNPTQFGPGEDYDEYPRILERDADLAEGVGVDAIFAPSADEMYPHGYSTYVTVEGITEKLCGKARPGHFRGVTTVVSKLFNIVRPDKAYFGQKDAQQFAVIKRMVEDLNMDIEVVPMPIIREADGVAKSSRNSYLNPQERNAAPILHRALMLADEMIEAGQRDAAKIIEAMEELIKGEPLASIDYVSIVDGDTLEDLHALKGKVLVALAVKIGPARLIDNIIRELE